MKRWILKGKINSDMYNAHYCFYLNWLINDIKSAGVEITPFGMECHKASANNWAKSDIDNKRDCLLSLIRHKRYIIVKNHNRFVVIDTEWKRHSAK